MGRPVGAQNKRSGYARKIVTEQLAGGDVLLRMLEIAEDLSNEPGVRLSAYKAIAPYVHPQLKAVEHTGEGGGPLSARIKVVFENAPPEPE